MHSQDVLLCSSCLCSVRAPVRGAAGSAIKTINPFRETDGKAERDKEKKDDHEDRERHLPSNLHKHCPISVNLFHVRALLRSLNIISVNEKCSHSSTESTSCLLFQEEKTEQKPLTWEINVLDEQEGLLLVCFMVMGRKRVTQLWQTTDDLLHNFWEARGGCETRQVISAVWGPQLLLT